MIRSLISKLYYALLALIDGPPQTRASIVTRVDCVEHGPTLLHMSRQTECCASYQWIPSGKVRSRIAAGAVVSLLMLTGCSLYPGPPHVRDCSMQREDDPDPRCPPPKHDVAEIYEKKDWVRGAVVTGFSNDGGCAFKPFVKVGDADNDPDDDSPQILGYSPSDVALDRNGNVIFERVREEVFIPQNRTKTVHGRMCRCPQG